MADVWGSEAREAVARALAAEASGYPVTGDVPVFAYVEADAVLEALTPYAVPVATVLKVADQYNALRAAVLAKAQYLDSVGGEDLVTAAELRALAGES